MKQVRLWDFLMPVVSTVEEWYMCKRCVDISEVQVSCQNNQQGQYGLTGDIPFEICGNAVNKFSDCRSQWPRGLRRRSTTARLLRSWVRIPPGAWMFVCCECCVLSGRGLCDELVTRPEESYRLWCVIVCDLETSRMRRPWPAWGRSATAKCNKTYFYKSMEQCRFLIIGSSRNIRLSEPECALPSPQNPTT